MKLKVLLGTDKSVNKQVIYHAANNLPALIIDCANVANPHKYFPKITEEQFAQMYVFELEMLYKLRDVLLQVPKVARDRKVNSIVVTTAHHLMNYQDEIENKDIYGHIWELLIKIGRKTKTIVAVVPGSIHEKIAKELPWDTRHLVNECS